MNYTLRREYPLTDEQNEVIDFLIKRTQAINACQTGFGKTYTRCTRYMSCFIKVPRYSRNYANSTESSKGI